MVVVVEFLVIPVCADLVELLAEWRVGMAEALGRSTIDSCCSYKRYSRFSEEMLLSLLSNFG